MSDNLQFWESVEKTDPKYTKQVKQRGGFTAIAAHSQVRLATDKFGMFGSGWGIKDESFMLSESVGLAIYQATFWYIDHGKNKCSFPIHSSIRYRTDKGYVDDDFVKKVATDALTKGLSKLGFNADVFMGLFDDNKYVNQLKSEFAEEVQEPDWEKKVIEASKSLDGKDRDDILELLADGKINGRNWAKSIERIREMSQS